MFIIINFLHLKQLKENINQARYENHSDSSSSFISSVASYRFKLSMYVLRKGIYRRLALKVLSFHIGKVVQWLWDPYPLERMNYFLIFYTLDQSKPQRWVLPLILHSITKSCLKTRFRYFHSDTIFLFWFNCRFFKYLKRSNFIIIM